ncbi:hypothetical protein BpHYR1_045065 [Brachionus plicatilis]|uniref:Uncharacterized protein n=1 Tax=Brachionus plicatilis TaxID=10195 RepID=A0A3M7SLG2_BRAPC|nr:hypothetical protein BpHYR1_045065 [Brachionus plicatilis]
MTYHLMHIEELEEFAWTSIVCYIYLIKTKQFSYNNIRIPFKKKKMINPRFRKEVYNLKNEDLRKKKS